MRPIRIPALIAAAVLAATGLATGTAHGHDKSAAPAAVPLWRSLAGFEKCVGLANNGSTANGTELVVWDCHGNYDQRWRFGF
ncbi:RICIN domain-containing protein [Streptomyces roseifaciens]